MHNESEIERIAIQYLSLAFSAAIFGSVAETAVGPTKYAVSLFYEKTKKEYLIVKDLLYNASLDGWVKFISFELF